MRFAALLAGLAITASSAADVLHLTIGDPARKELEARVVLDGITDTRSGELLAPGELARRLASTNILFVGEEHTSVDSHRVQLQSIEALVAAGREVLIALEMFPYTRQDVLDRYARGELAEQDFMAAWYEYWSHHWNYYRPIFEYARSKRLPLIAVNVPREAVRLARTQGFDAFDAETRRRLPPVVDIASDEHRRMFAASFAGDDALHSTLPEKELEGIYRAQATWDAAMGWNSMQALGERGGDDAIVVVLLGSGHVAYGLGAERQIASHFKGTIRSLIPVRVRDENGRDVSSVQASYADFVWGVPPAAGPEFPVLGVSLAGSLGRNPTRVIQVETGSSAEQAGVQVGDILLSLDAHEIKSSATLQRAISGFAWGDAGVLQVKRGEENKRIPVAFRRVLPKG